MVASASIKFLFLKEKSDKDKSTMAQYSVLVLIVKTNSFEQEHLVCL